jgi:hydroxymethylpyrimidine kinase/phosphomethylpyrimidine kinase
LIPNILSIAGTDPSGGAGIQADLKSISANGGYGMCAITALVAQNTQGVREVFYPPVAFLRAQLDAVADDVRIDAIKIGMLGKLDVIETVSDWLRGQNAPVVLDPVMVATSGDRLLDEAAEHALIELASRVHVLTPNVPELAVLAGAVPATSNTIAFDQAAAVAQSTGAMVVAKGGHLSNATVVDALIDGSGVVAETSHRRIDTKNTHGTGCSLSSAIATRYAVTKSWERALIEASDWLAEAIGAADELQVGQGHGPVHHFARLWKHSHGEKS